MAEADGEAELALSATAFVGDGADSEDGAAVASADGATDAVVGLAVPNTTDDAIVETPCRILI